MAPILPLCPQSLTRSLTQSLSQSFTSLDKRDLAEKAKSTADAFKNWDSCMGNTFCKIVAIVGICLGGLLVLWVLVALVRCCCCGVTTFAACCAICSCCACCCNDNTQRTLSQGNYSAANNANMYPQNQPYRGYNYQPEPSYSNQENHHLYQEPGHNSDYVSDYRSYRGDVDSMELKKMAPTANVYEVSERPAARF